MVILFYLYSLFGARLSEVAESSQEMLYAMTFAADCKKDGGSCGGSGVAAY